MTDTDQGTASTRRTPSSQMQRAGFGAVAVAVVIAVVRDTAQSNAAMAYDPQAAAGVGELPTYLVTGVVAYALCLPGLLLLRRRWSPERAGRVALIWGLLALLPFLVTYWTALPVTFGAFAIMTGLDAGPRPTGRAGLVLGLLAILASVAALVYRMAGGQAQV